MKSVAVRGIGFESQPQECFTSLRQALPSNRHPRPLSGGDRQHETFLSYFTSLVARQSATGDKLRVNVAEPRLADERETPGPMSTVVLREMGVQQWHVPQAP